MFRIIRTGRVVLVLNGRYAGKKAMILSLERSDKPCPRALVAGISRYPRKIITRLSKKKMERRCKIKPFLKWINFNHLMPTRYSMEALPSSSGLTPVALRDPGRKLKARLEVKQHFEERFKQGQNRWFFQKLRF